MAIPFTLETPPIKNHGYVQRLSIKYTILREKKKKEFQCLLIK